MSQTTHYSPARESPTLVAAEQEAGSSSSYGRKVLYLIGFFSLLRLLVAFTLELGNDESYYWLYGQQLQWNYFDHPPLVALWVRLFTANLALQDWEGFVRLGSVVGCALSTWFIYKASSTLHSERVGWLAAVLYNTSFYAGVIAGILIWPDSPQMVFWTFSLWMLARVVRHDRDWGSWLLFGLASGLCIMSKVHGVFLWAGLGLYILFRQRAWLLRPQLYAALFLTVAVATPILVWNVQHDFATYRFHSGRVKVEELTVNAVSFGEEVAGQLLFNNPFTVLLAVAGLLAWRKHSRLRALQVYNLVALPLIGLLLAVSLFRDTILPHWSGPAYVTLLPLAAVQLQAWDSRQLFPQMLRWCLGACAVFFISWNALVHVYPGTLGVRSGTELGSGDPSLDLYGWKEAGATFAAFHQREVQKGTMPANTPLIARKWWGAHVEYYFARPAGLTLIGLGWEHLHHYLWLNQQRSEHANLSAAYCIIPSDEYYDAQQAYSDYYNSIELVNTITTYRSGRPAHNFYVYRLSDWKGRVRYMDVVHRP